MNYSLTFKHQQDTGEVILEVTPEHTPQEEVFCLVCEIYSIKRDAKGRIPIRKIVDRFVELHPGARVKTLLEACDEFDFKGARVNSINLNDFNDVKWSSFLKNADKSQVEIVKTEGLDVKKLTVFKLHLFPSLKVLKLPEYVRMDRVNLSGCHPTLTELDLRGNKLPLLDLSGFPQLVKLNLCGNRLETIDLTCCERLKKAHLGNNILTNIKISNPELVSLNCLVNPLSSIFRLKKKDVPKLRKFSCGSTNITALFLPNLHLKCVEVGDNRLNAIYFKGKCDEKITINQSNERSYVFCIGTPVKFNLRWPVKLWISSNIRLDRATFMRFFHCNKIRGVINTLPFPIAEEILDHISAFKTDYVRELEDLERQKNSA